MLVKTHILLLVAPVFQFCQAKPAVVEWYLKKQDKERKDKAASRVGDEKHNTHDHAKEWQATVAEVKGEAPPKRKYGKKTKYVPASEKKDTKPIKKEVEVHKAKTQKQHQFEVKPVAASKSGGKPVTTAAAKSATSLHNTMSGGKAQVVKAKSGSKDKAHKAHKKSHYAAGPAMGPGPAPAPAPAPLTYDQQVSKLKGDMMHKLKVDSFDADLIIHRPTATPPGNGNAEVPVPEFKDIGNDFGPYAKKPAPLKHDDIAFKPGSLPVDAAHVNRQTMTSDWHMEYGPNGPKGIHGTSPGGNFLPNGIAGGQFLPLQQR